MCALPLRDEQTPLVENLKSHGGLKIRQIREIIQQCFNLAAVALEQAGKEDQAADLRSATVHWLRHTAISADVQHRPADHVRLDAGHESITTTTRYIDVDRIDRHQSAKDKTLLPINKEV